MGGFFADGPVPELSRTALSIPLSLILLSYSDMNTIDYLRQFRIGDYAVFDFTAGFLGMLLLSPLLSRLFNKAGIHIPKRNWVILMLPISVLAHILVGKITPLTKDFLDANGHYLLKFIIIGCCVLGTLGIKRSAPTATAKQ